MAPMRAACASIISSCRRITANRRFTPSRPASYACQRHHLLEAEAELLRSADQSHPLDVGSLEALVAVAGIDRRLEQAQLHVQAHRVAGQARTAAELGNQHGVPLDLGIKPQV